MMQSFASATTRDPTARVAEQMLACMPLFVKFVRLQMRSRRGPSLTVPQFRALVFVMHNRPARLASMAEHVGVSLPTASRLVDGLVRRRMLVRTPDARDRRTLTIELSPLGRRVVDRAWSGTLQAVADRMRGLSRPQLHAMRDSLITMHAMFASAREPSPSDPPSRTPPTRASAASRSKESV